MPGSARQGRVRRWRWYQSSSAAAEGDSVAEGTERGIATQERHVYGPRPVGALVPRLTRPAFRRHSPASAQIMSDWPAIVGPALAVVTAPRRLSTGTLTIACAGPIAVELQHLAGELMARINGHVGSAPVQRLRFVQFALPAVPATRPRAISSRAREKAAAMVAELPEGGLRDALAALGSVVIARDVPDSDTNA